METNYRFDPVCNHEGVVSPFHHIFNDEKDFVVNPTLIKQLKLSDCHETTPEGRAFWLYLRLCQVLKYDEGYFYHTHRNHPNDDPYESFKIVGDVTAETPVTCFNFSRIAVKLLNQIPGVHAVIIAVGQHFRFGFYTGEVVIDVEPTSPRQHFNDLARVKLGITPRGLNVFCGHKYMYDLAQRIAASMLLKTRLNYREYLNVLRRTPALRPETQIKIEPLITNLKKHGLDGSSTVQLLVNMNHQFIQPPYKLLRAGVVKGTDQVQPQLLVRENNQLKRIDLIQMEVSNLPITTFDKAFTCGEMVNSDDSDTERFSAFSSGLSADNNSTSQVTGVVSTLEREL